MFHQRLANEFLMALSMRALGIIAPALREEEQREAFDEFHSAFKEELLRYEQARERMRARLAGRSEASVRWADDEITQTPATGRDSPAGCDGAAG